MIREEELEPIGTNGPVLRDPNPSSRKEIILVKYENILKGVDIHLMEILSKKKIRAQLESILDYNMVTTDTDTLLLKNHTNVLMWIAKQIPEDDSLDKLRMDLIDRYIDFYLRSPELPMASNLRMLLGTKNIVKELLIWHERLDHRVTIDIEDMFGDDPRVHLLNGPLEDIFKERGDITTFFTDDVSDIGTIMSVSNITYMELCVTMTMNNFDQDGMFLLDSDDFMVENTCKLATFIPYDIKGVDGKEFIDGNYSKKETEEE